MSKKKIPPKNQKDHYVDGLVSTGNQIPYTILKRIFSLIKKIFIYFINIWFPDLWKSHFFIKNVFLPKRLSS
jgi:hypothetical protein